jgi:hypothetical protein
MLPPGVIADEILASTTIVTDRALLRSLLEHAARTGIESVRIGTPPPPIIPAQPGWRLAVLGPDDDLEACPIVAWAVTNDGLEPVARWHSQDGYAGASLNAGRPDHVVGILAPGDELNEGWLAAGHSLAQTLRIEEGATTAS